MPQVTCKMLTNSSDHACDFTSQLHELKMAAYLAVEDCFCSYCCFPGWDLTRLSKYMHGNGLSLVFYFEKCTYILMICLLFFCKSVSSEFEAVPQCVVLYALQQVELCLCTVGRISWGSLRWRGMASPRGREAEWSPSPTFLLSLFAKPRLLPGNPASQHGACGPVRLWSAVSRLDYKSMLFIWTFSVRDKTAVWMFKPRTSQGVSCSILASMNCS